MDNAFRNLALATAGSPNGISDFGPYPASMTARYSVRGPGAYNLNVSLSKTFPIHKRLKFELRGRLQRHQPPQPLPPGLALNAANYNAFDPNTGIATGASPQVSASKGGVTGGANDERRFRTHRPSHRPMNSPQMT